MNILDQILQIKDFREGRAQAAVQVERAALERKAVARDAAENQLNAFRDDMATREAQLFTGLMSQAVQVRDILEVHHEVGEMRSQERGFANVLDRAVNDCKAQEAVVQSAQKVFLRAQVACQKFRGLVDDDLVRRVREAERMEESDGEEAAQAICRPSSRDVQGAGDD